MSCMRVAAAAVQSADDSRQTGAFSEDERTRNGSIASAKLSKSRENAALHFGHATAKSACKIIRLSTVRLPLLFRPPPGRSPSARQLLAELEYRFRGGRGSVRRNC